MDGNRKCAYLSLMDVETKDAYSNIALNHRLLCNRPESESFVRELVYGVLENKIYLDHIIEKLSDSGSSKLKAPVRTILRMGIYQLAFMNSVPEYAAVNESVVLAKRYAKGREGFVNAIMRAYIRRGHSVEIPERERDAEGYLSLKYSYEPWIVKLMLSQFSLDFTEELLAAGNERPPLTLRANRLRISREELKKRLSERGFSVSDGEYCNMALRLRGGRLTESSLYRDGFLSIQDESSQLCVEILDPKAGELVVDSCAAPGGKTAAMAELMGNEGRIIACDIYRRRLGLVEAEMKRLGIKIVETRPHNSEFSIEALAGKADKVLCDVPCSGLGVVRRKPEIKGKKRKPEMDLLPEKQFAILSSSAKYLKSGGSLVYSSCTINSEENKDVVERFLRQNSDFEAAETKQLLPNINGTDGFFICKLIKR